MEGMDVMEARQQICVICPPSPSSLEHPCSLRQYKPSLPHQPRAGSDEVQVVELARVLVDLVDRGFHAEGRAMRTRRAHRLDRVCNRKHACLDQDVVALDTARIAAAVEAFVMLEDDLC